MAELRQSAEQQTKMDFLCTLVLIAALCFGGVCQLFVGNPPPFRFDTAAIEELVMPLNGDPASGVGQRMFPCKGHHLPDVDHDPVNVVWNAGDTVIYQ